jgi:hypothetical protein
MADPFGGRSTFALLAGLTWSMWFACSWAATAQMNAAHYLRELHKRADAKPVSCPSFLDIPRLQLHRTALCCSQALQAHRHLRRLPLIPDNYAAKLACEEKIALLHSCNRHESWRSGSLRTAGRRLDLCRTATCSRRPSTVVGRMCIHRQGSTNQGSPSSAMALPQSCSAKILRSCSA